MCQAVVHEYRTGQREHLGLVLQTTESRGKNDAVIIPQKGGPELRGARRGEGPAGRSRPFSTVQLLPVHLMSSYDWAQIYGLINFQLIPPGEPGEGNMWLGLVPEYHRGNIILQRQVPSLAPPSQGLDSNLQAFFKSNGISDMPAVETKTLRDVIMTISPDHLVQAGVRTTELRIGRSLYAGRIFMPGIEVVRSAEIILGPGATDGGKIRIPVHEKFYFTFAPPAIIVNSISQVSAHILSF